MLLNSASVGVYPNSSAAVAVVFGVDFAADGVYSFGEKGRYENPFTWVGLLPFFLMLR